MQDSIAKEKSWGRNGWESVPLKGGGGEEFDGRWQMPF